MNSVIKGAACLLLMVMALSCKKKDVISQAKADDNIINKYITNNNLNAIATGSGLYYVMNTVGTGSNPSSNSYVTVKYKGYLTNGTTFDISSSYSTKLTSVIKGWQEGIPLFKKGGKGMLLVPSALGYGATATGNIPANSVLIFDIELLDVK